MAKEIEISTELGALEEDTSPEGAKLTEQLAVAENSNKKLKDLLLFHLDLIQQQNEQINKKDKLYNALKQENDTVSLFTIKKKSKCLCTLNAVCTM